MSVISRKNIRVGIWTTVAVGALVAIKFGLHAAGFEFLAVNTLFSSAIGGAVFIVGFLLAGIIADYKEAEKVPAELRASLENIVEEGRIFQLTKREFDERKMRATALGIIKDFFRGLSHEGNHNDLQPCLRSVDSLSDSFLEMERLGMPPNYVTRLKTEQGNLRRIVLRVYHMQRTQFIPSAHFLAMSLVGLVILLMLFIKTEGTPESTVIFAVISYLFLYVARLIQIIEKPFREGHQSQDDVSLFLLHEFENKIKL
jgi:hypothetical protein